MRKTTLSITLRFLLLAVSLTLMVGKASAQCFTFSDSLAEYNNESYDGTYAYTSSELSGGVTMNISPSCAGHLPTFYHTPEAFNRITGNDGSSVGGWGYGAQTCEDCYLEYVNNQQWVPKPGVVYTDSIEVEAVCTGGGEFFGAGLDFDVYLLNTFGKWTGQTTTDPEDGDPQGIYQASCSSGTQVCPYLDANWKIEFAKGETPWSYASTPFLSLWWQYGNLKELFSCIQDPISIPASGSGPCF